MNFKCVILKRSSSTWNTLCIYPSLIILPVQRKRRIDRIIPKWSWHNLFNSMKGLRRGRSEGIDKFAAWMHSREQEAVREKAAWKVKASASKRTGGICK